MPRPALTLLVIYPHKLVRADFARGAAPRLLELWQQPRPDIEDTGILVEAATQQGPKLRGAVWILWSDLFAQSLRLDAKSMGLAGKDLQRTLAFEAEPLSGIVALDSLVAYRQTGAEKGEREFWVLQAPQRDVELLRDTVARLGGRLAGVTSTAGLDMPLAVDLDSASADDQQLRDWLHQCAAALTRKHEQPIAIAPPVRPLTNGQRWLIALGVALPVALLCWAMNTYFAGPQLAEMRDELKKHQAAIEKVKGIDKQIGDLTSQKTELVRTNGDLQRALAVLGTQRMRTAGLLSNLASYRCDDLIILKIDARAGEPTVHGLCMKPGIATVFAHKMGEKVQGLGWQAESPRSEAQNILANGGPWSFELHFQDVLAPADLISKAPPKSLKK
jgi:hypothetical protein